MLVKHKFFWDAIRALILAVFLHAEATKFFVACSKYNLRTGYQIQKKVHLEVLDEIVKPHILEKPIGETQVEMYCCRVQHKKETTAF